MSLAHPRGRVGPQSVVFPPFSSNDFPPMRRSICVHGHSLVSEPRDVAPGPAKGQPPSVRLVECTGLRHERVGRIENPQSKTSCVASDSVSSWTEAVVMLGRFKARVRFGGGVRLRCQMECGYRRG